MRCPGCKKNVAPVTERVTQAVEEAELVARKRPPRVRTVIVVYCPVCGYVFSTRWS